MTDIIERLGSQICFSLHPHNLPYTSKLSVPVLHMWLVQLVLLPCWRSFRAQNMPLMDPMELPNTPISATACFICCSFAQMAQWDVNQGNVSILYLDLNIMANQILKTFQSYQMTMWAQSIWVRVVIEIVESS